MRIRSLLTLLVGITAAVGTIALAVLRPTVGHAQVAASSPSVVAGGEYQLAVLPGGPDDPKQWLVFNTRTGELEHWIERRDHYAVFTQLKPGRITTGFERVPKSPAGR